MLAKVSERAMHWSRWTLLIGWGIIIVSLFYDPVSIQLTAPDNLASPLSLDLERCIQVQAQCLQESPYALGAPIFWNIIIPASIFILLVFGHDSWRRICPLAFISQTPSALGWVRRHKRTNPITGKALYKTVKVAKDSWLGRNHLYLQFGLFYLGLCSRILFINSHRIALGSVLITTIVAALTVGFLYGGKTWCQYFCPMAPVQKIYAEPRGLLNSTAHEGERQLISQSMCRTVTPGGKEKVACVGCKSFCIDIDAERSYWQSIHKTQQQGLYYGYVGIVLGYFA
ncbi:MAG: 4Fe-4S binding protein, partial [Cyanobacteria bacterium P01_F01_bin.86]